MSHFTQKALAAHFRRLALLSLNLMCNNILFYRLIGLWNQRAKMIKTVFVAYPASEKYTQAYVYSWYKHKMKWKPWPAGIFFQNGKWGLMTIITSVEKDFIDENNAEKLQELQQQMEKMRCLLNAQQATYAGILPGVFYKKGISSSTIEASVTVNVIIRAEKELRESLGYSDSTPLIILGAKGFIGSQLAEQYVHRELYTIDLDNREDFPAHLKGKETILINLTNRSALRQYTSRFWKELVLLNEAYPEPSPSILKTLTNKGCLAYHVVGVKAKSFPAFPKVYKGGIPCCAAWLSSDMEVIIKALNNPIIKVQELVSIYDKSASANSPISILNDSGLATKNRTMK